MLQASGLCFSCAVSLPQTAVSVTEDVISCDQHLPGLEILHIRIVPAFVCTRGASKQSPSEQLAGHWLHGGNPQCVCSIETWGDSLVSPLCFCRG